MEYECEICKKVLRSKKGLSGHVQMQHPQVFKSDGQANFPTALSSSAPLPISSLSSDLLENRKNYLANLQIEKQISQLEKKDVVQDNGRLLALEKENDFLKNRFLEQERENVSERRHQELIKILSEKKEVVPVSPSAEIEELKLARALNDRKFDLLIKEIDVLHTGVQKWLPSLIQQGRKNLEAGGEERRGKLKEYSPAELEAIEKRLAGDDKKKINLEAEKDVP